MADTSGLAAQPKDLTATAVLDVAAGLDLVVISDNEVLVQFGTRSRPSELLRDKDVTGILGRVVARLQRGPTSFNDLLGAVEPQQESDVRLLLTDLINRGIVADRRSSPVEQYLRYTFDGEPHAATSRISLIGAGPLGARIAQILLQHGLGSVTLLDDRSPDATWQAYMPFAGLATAEGGRADAVLRERLSVPVECLDTKLDFAGVEATVARADFVILALEQPDLRVAHWVNRLAIRERKPWLLATIDGNLGLVGPLFQPLETACFNDYQTLSAAATASPLMARKYREHRSGRSSSFFTGLPSYAEIVAGHAALAAVHFLLRGTCFALGRVMVIDFDRMRIDVEDVLKLPRCPVCGTQKSAYRPPFPP